ncbi:MAG: SpoIIE family protein phosphatase [Magnetococcales bacterium]|nr:SpoIIE family protein phosphatase [Magnetococcales bacterium]
MLAKRPTRPTILVVDDTPENIDVLKGALTPGYVIKPATNGVVALKIASIHPQPDLILLDIMMPEMDGYEVCRRLKADAATQDIPIMFVTAKSGEADELQGLRLGAVDYITKPFSVPIVQSRVKTHLALRNANQKLATHNKHLMEERNLIESILLKMRHADGFHGEHVRCIVSPVESTAGDLLLSTVTPDGRHWILLGDFTGHGLSAAIGGPLISYIFHDLAIRNAPAQTMIDTINTQLCARLPTGLFFAASLIETDPDRRGGTVWNAGLPDCVLMRQGQVSALFPSLLPPLGIVARLDMGAAATPLTWMAGDRLYAFSDGVVEARAPTDEMFGSDRMYAFLSMVSQSSQPLEQLMERLVAHTGTSALEDDVTLVEVCAT